MDGFKKFAVLVGLTMAIAFISVCLFMAFLYQIYVAYGLAAAAVLAALRWLVLPILKQGSEIVLGWRNPPPYIVRDGRDGEQTHAVIHQGQLIRVGEHAQSPIDPQIFLQMVRQQVTMVMESEYDIVDADEGDPSNLLLPQVSTVADQYEKCLTSVLAAFQIYAVVAPSATRVGPSVIQLGVIPMENQGRRTRIEEITKREKDIQLALGAKSIRILSPVPGERYVGIEIPNPAPITVTIADVLESSEYQEASAHSNLVFTLGRDITGKVRVCDIEKAPHILIGGATNQGKSVLLNVLITCLLSQATPKEVRLLMVDPKQVELTPYNGVPHLLRPVITDMTQVVPMLKRAIDEMERRTKIFARLGVRKLSEYREIRLHRPELENLPAWVIIFDEFADLMITTSKKGEEKQDKVETIVCRLAQMARAVGIHLVISTQRPSVDVITGLIKANFPTRIALTTTAVVDSRTIIDMGGAERLLGNGDMLYVHADAGRPERIQGAYITREEIRSVIARALDGVQSPLVSDEKVVYLPSRIATKQASDQEDDGSLRNESEMSRNGSRNEQEMALEAHLHAKMLEVMDFYRDHPDSNQTDCMKEVWNAKPGDNDPWKLARREFTDVQRMINELARRGMSAQNGDGALGQQAEEG